MPFSDAEKNREYQRDYQRAKRASEAKPRRVKPLTADEVRTARGIRDELAEQIAIVSSAKADALMKARCIAFVASVALRAVETADLEARLTELEQQLKGIQ